MHSSGSCPSTAAAPRPTVGSSAGVPELIAEVSHTSRYTDLGPKFDDYERVGVLEYVVRALDPDEVLWFVLREGRFVALPPDSQGIFRSEFSPGSGSIHWP